MPGWPEQNRHDLPRSAMPLERLRAAVKKEIPPGRLVVIANREPYSHVRTESGSIRVERPASGLVTAIEPVLRACGGTWIGHGSGNADREHSDSHGRLSVPPEKPEYTLRRVWLDDDTYDRYYCGLSNEALWPLCHLAYTQPTFRSEDWDAYCEVNERFAAAAAAELNRDSLLLIQDYHFALVPQLVRQRAPHVVSSIFWHIPWPNPEVFRILPWKETLLEGMLGADIIGFHTRQYCLNFLDTVARYTRFHVDLEQLTVSCGERKVRVRPYPISVEWPYASASLGEGTALRRSLGIADDVHVSVGVDRADYTKGLLERVAAVGLFLEQNPSLHGKYTLVQLASPTRSSIQKYQQLSDDLVVAVDAINARFATDDWTPVILQMRTFSPDEVKKHYAMANSALVTPLHDGMNLVAKEYVAACDSEDGVLILSTFAGAARELGSALLVNPYDIQQVANAIVRATEMPLGERRARMRSMRDQIATHSIFDWSEKLITDMAEARHRRSSVHHIGRSAVEIGREVAAR